MRVCFCGPLRPGNAITAAPLRDGTYQPFELEAVRRRERHVLVTRRRGGSAARPPGPRGSSRSRARSGAATMKAMSAAGARRAARGAAVAPGEPPSVRRVRHSVTAPSPMQDQAGRDREQAGEVVARRRRPRGRSGRPRSRRRCRARRRTGRARRAGRRAGAGRPRRRGPSRASGTRPLTTWSPGEVPGCGCRKLSSSTCSAIRASRDQEEEGLATPAAPPRARRGGRGGGPRDGGGHRSAPATRSGARRAR